MIVLYVHMLSLKNCNYCAHFPAASRNHIKVLAEDAVVMGWLFLSLIIVVVSLELQVELSHQKAGMPLKFVVWSWIPTYLTPIPFPADLP